ncbi:MAG: hypothetical protein V4558_13570 [Gemmatimonadota bacterium]
MTIRRIGPALALLIISPLIAEFLLGDFNIRQIAFALVFVPQYGGGALLAREVTRRTNRGWPTMLLLALVFALITEGFTNQTLFNPNYAGQHLLAYGFIPALGTSLHFTTYLLTLHVVWSLGSSIAIAEGLAGARWREPWLRLPGLLVCSFLFLIGCAMTTSFTLRTFHFVASVGQFAAVGVCILLATAVAFLGFRSSDDPSATSTSRLPSAGVVLVASLLLCSAFQFWFGYAPRHGVNAAFALLSLIGIVACSLALFGKWSRRAGWGPTSVLAASMGAVLTYGWLSLRRFIVSGGTSLGVPTTPIDVVGQVCLLFLMLGLGYIGWRRLPAARSSGREHFANETT